MRGAQDCSEREQGAHTGEISATMLNDIGCDFCIVGHSERRTNHGETNAQVQNKASQVISNDIAAIICVGETLEQRESGQEFSIVEQQIKESLPDGANSSKHYYCL